MSLDVYLVGPKRKREGSGIFVRAGGSTQEISRAEWDAKFPGREPCVVTPDEDDHTIYSGNITHNLNTMAKEAGIYEALWRPEEIGISRAGELVGLLREGLATLRSDPVRFRVHNPDNGWGDYEGLVRFVADYLSACEQDPDATIEVSR